MHSFNGKSVNIHFNGDYSGNIVINNTKDGDEYKEITIDIQDIFDFVAGYVRSEKISMLEEMDSKEVLLSQTENYPQIMGKINENIFSIINKTTWAIKEGGLSGYNIVSGDMSVVSKCIKFIDDSFQEDHYMSIINAAQELFPDLKWRYALEESFKENNVEYVYVKDTGCWPVSKYNETNDLVED